MPLKKEKLSMFWLMVCKSHRSTNLREHAPAILLLGQTGLAVGNSGSGSGLSLCDDVGLVNSALDDLLLLRVEVLCKILIQRGLLLLKFCDLSVLFYANNP
jgi:hypothetical protein